MDDTGCRGFFLEPVATYHRQYEALRAFFIEGRHLHDIAQQFGYRETSLRSMVCRFRAQVQAGEVPPFLGNRPWAPPAAASSSRRSHPRDDSRRRCARVEPGSGTSSAHARRGGVSLPALVGPCPLRAPGQPSRLSWLHDGARDQCVIELARPEAPGHRTAQPHQRL